MSVFQKMVLILSMMLCVSCASPVVEQQNNQEVSWFDANNHQNSKVVPVNNYTLGS